VIPFVCGGFRRFGCAVGDRYEPLQTSSWLTKQSNEQSNAPGRHAAATSYRSPDDSPAPADAGHSGSPPAGPGKPTFTPCSTRGARSPHTPDPAAGRPTTTDPTRPPAARALLPGKRQHTSAETGRDQPPDQTRLSPRRPTPNASSRPNPIPPPRIAGSRPRRRTHGELDPLRQRTTRQPITCRAVLVHDPRTPLDFPQMQQQLVRTAHRPSRGHLARRLIKDSECRLACVHTQTDCVVGPRRSDSFDAPERCSRSALSAAYTDVPTPALRGAIS